MCVENTCARVGCALSRRINTLYDPVTLISQSLTHSAQSLHVRRARCVACVRACVCAGTGVALAAAACARARTSLLRYRDIIKPRISVSRGPRRGTICYKRQTGCYSRPPPWPCSLPPLQYFHSLLNLFHTLASSDLLPVRHRPTHPSMVSASSAVATASVPAAPMQHDTHRSNSRQQVPCSACSSQPSQLKRPRCAAPQQPSGSSCSR